MKCYTYSKFLSKPSSFKIYKVKLNVTFSIEAKIIYLYNATFESTSVL